MSKFLLLAVAIALLAACGGIEVPSSAPLPHDSWPKRTTETTSNYSITYQGNAQHTGYLRGTLRPPLTVLWTVKLGGRADGGIGYPVVANGIVVVAANRRLFALDVTSGKILWSKAAVRGWVGPAYENGTIFSNPVSTLYRKQKFAMYAFDERSGEVLWAKKAPREWAFSSPPTAAQGMVYTAASGDGGLVYGYAASNGVLDWTAGVANGDDSSPSVTPHGVYVAYECPQAYDFNPTTGKQIWRYSGSCTGGGGSTPVVYGGLVFVGDGFVTSSYDGFILTADKGKVVGRFHSNFTPAIANHRGFFVGGYGASLEAAEIPSMRQIWSVSPPGDKYTTPPLVVGDTVYIETADGELFGYASNSGKQEVEMHLGSGGYFGKSVGLGYGSGALIVPDRNKLYALAGS
jgi:outer membrane protein assembly factor BamB